MGKEVEKSHPPRTGCLNVKHDKSLGSNWSFNVGEPISIRDCWRRFYTAKQPLKVTLTARIIISLTTSMSRATTSRKAKRWKMKPNMKEKLYSVGLFSLIITLQRV